jgi:hypothetical protein
LWLGFLGSVCFALPVTDLQKAGLQGPVQSVVSNDTQQVYSETGALVSPQKTSSATIQYDSENRPSLKTEGSVKTFYKYGFGGLLEKMTVCNDATKKCKSQEFEYNSDGFLVNENFCEGQGTEYTCPSFIKNVYNDNNRLRERNQYDSIGNMKKSIVYTYDKKGRLNEETESQIVGGRKITLRFCEYKNDSYGNWISRKCFQNKKESVTDRKIVYYGGGSVESSSAAPDSLAPSVNRGTFPVTGGIVDGDFVIDKEVPLSLSLNVSGLNGQVKKMNRKIFGFENKIRVFKMASEEGYDEAGMQMYWVKLDSAAVPLVRLSLRKDSAGIHFDVENDSGVVIKMGDLNVVTNNFGDWQTVEIIPGKGFTNLESPVQYIHRYDKLGRMRRRNDLRFEYNSAGNIDKVWYSDARFDAFFFSGAGKMLKIIRYDCSSGKCSIETKSTVKLDKMGNIIEERKTDRDGVPLELMLTEIEYYP